MALKRWQASWMRNVVIGSVLSGPSGWRVVRDVSRYKNGDLRGVTFAIKRCSWTGRCYTVYGYNDLRQLGYRMVRVRPRTLKSKIDRTIHRAINEASDVRPYAASCCDVEGVA